MKKIRAVISLLLASAGFLAAAPAVDVAITQPVRWLKP